MAKNSQPPSGLAAIYQNDFAAFSRLPAPPFFAASFRCHSAAPLSPFCALFCNSGFGSELDFPASRMPFYKLHYLRGRGREKGRREREKGRREREGEEGERGREGRKRKRAGWGRERKMEAEIENNNDKDFVLLCTFCSCFIHSVLMPG